MSTEIVIQASPEAKKAFSKLAGNWWLPLVEGILSVVVGIYAAVNFGSGFEAMAMMVAAFLTASGVVGLYGALVSGDYEGKFFTVILSIARVAAGLFLIVLPGLAEMTLIVITGAAFLTHAASVVAMSIFMKKTGVKDWGWILALGIVMVINAGIIIADPFVSVALISVAVSTDLLITGVHDIVLAIRMKKLKNALDA